jgi:hypothetical protein
MLNMGDLVTLDETLVLDLGIDISLILPGVLEPSLSCACFAIASGLEAQIVLGTSGSLSTEAELNLEGDRLLAGGAVLAAVVGLDAAVDPPPGITISRIGDIYLDWSRVEVGRFSAKIILDLKCTSSGRFRSWTP